MATRQEQAQEINELQDEIGAKHRPKIERAILDAMLEVAKNLPTQQRPDPPLDHFRRVETALSDLYREMTRRSAAKVVGGFKSGYLWIETKDGLDDFYERIYEEYLREFGGASISAITATTRSQIIRLIDTGLREGQSVDEIAAGISEAAPALAGVRAAIIARTETHSASMYASLQSAKRSTIPLDKEWVSVEDGRTRDSGEGDGVVDGFNHRIMNGVTVGIDEPFEVPTKFGTIERLMFPGDPNGSAGNIINCRCAQTYTSSDDDDEEDATPRQREPGGPEFLFQTIADPAANTFAMHDFIINNGIADRALLKGITARTLAPHLRRFLEIKERFGLDPMIGVGPASRFMQRAGRIRALAAIYPVRNRVTGRMAVWHMPTNFGNRRHWEGVVSTSVRGRANPARIERRQQRLSRSTTPEEVRSRAQRMDQEGTHYAFTAEFDGTTAESVDAAIRSTIDHEFGHVVHLTNTAQPRMAEEINAFLHAERPRANGWDLLVSHYGGSNDAEYVAETFSIYMRGDPAQTYRIHPTLLSIYERYDRLSSSKSYRLQGVPFMYTETKDEDPVEDGVILIQTVLAAPVSDRDRIARELLNAYTGDDKELIKIWLAEARTLSEVDTLLD